MVRQLAMLARAGGTVVVIDTHLRQPTATLSIGAAPTQAIIAGGYGLCH